MMIPAGLSIACATRGASYTNTTEEYFDLRMVCHHLDPSVPEELTLAENII